MKQCPSCQTAFDQEIAFCPKDGNRLHFVSQVLDPGAEARDTIPPAPGEGPPATEEDLVGRTLADRYTILRRLGEGGMGVVYAAVDTRLEKEVAIKVLREDFAHRPDVVARFTQEAKSAARIKHENVLDVTDYDTTRDGKFYIAMELLVGTDLADVLQKSGTIDVQRGLDIGIQICRALSAAHAKGIVHRDMKPENIFLVTNDEGREVVKVVDFGIAQMKDLSGGSDGARKLTRTGMIFGTPEYMSPEQAAGKSIDQRVDVYATGVILYEMFAGRVPFVGETFMGVLTQHMFEPVPPIRQINAHATLSTELESVIFHALSKDPAQRYASMQELSDDLARLRNGLQVSTPLDNARAMMPAGLTARQQAAHPSPAQVGVAPTIELATTPRSRGKIFLLGGALVLVGMLAVLGATALGGSHQGGTTPPVTPPRTDPTPPTNPLAAADAGAAQVGSHAVPPATPDAGPALVHVRVTTGAVAAALRVEGADAGLVAGCPATPCEVSLPPGQPLTLVATARGKRGSLQVTPSRDGEEFAVALRAVGGRPPGPGHATNNNSTPCGRRTADGLLVPCFNN